MKISKNQLKQIIREQMKSTEKYDDDSALKGDQDELPDALQKGIIDKAKKEKKNESREEYLQRVVQEVQDVLELPDPSGVMALEDNWSGGQDNLHLSVDHAAQVHGAEENVKAPEVMAISELRNLVRSIILEAKKKN